MAPPMVRKSVVAHEVAHLRHMNHSAAFYGHLDQIFEGNRKEADHWLKQHGGNLHLIGVGQRA
jgi:predicted metal-dependent hydrolase